MKGTGVQKLLPNGRKLLRGKTLGERSVLLRDCLLLLCGGFLLSGIGIQGRALPLAACLVAAQPFGLRAMATAFGACLGYFLRCDGAEAAELIALCMMSLAQSAVFQGTSLPRFRWFSPCLTAGVCAVLSGVGLLGGDGAVTLWTVRVVLAGIDCAAAPDGSIGGRCFALGAASGSRTSLRGRFVLREAGAAADGGAGDRVGCVRRADPCNGCTAAACRTLPPPFARGASVALHALLRPASESDACTVWGGKRRELHGDLCGRGAGDACAAVRLV